MIKVKYSLFKNKAYIIARGSFHIDNLLDEQEKLIDIGYKVIKPLHPLSLGGLGIIMKKDNSKLEFRVENLREW